ncbi:MAG TPA: hypothetical protein VII31_08700 [Caldimonas sp.]
MVVLVGERGIVAVVLVGDALPVGTPACAYLEGCGLIRTEKLGRVPASWSAMASAPSVSSHAARFDRIMEILRRRRLR